jgi:hypothetical protein
MQRVLAIASLTWKAAFRYRLFWVMSVLLVGAVVGLPLLIKDDGSAQGMTQILLTYTLSAISALLGIATLWLSCGLLARDIEECQMQVVSVKPIARWQIWIGKWLGILSLDAVLLALAGASVFAVLQVRARQLAPDQQKILREQIFVARSAAKERQQDLKPMIDQVMQKQLQRIKGTELTEHDILELRNQVSNEVSAIRQEIPPGYGRVWRIDLSSVKSTIQDQPLQIRVKFHTPNPNPDATYETLWQVGSPESAHSVRFAEILPADSFQEFNVPANLLDANGRLVIACINSSDTPLLISDDDGFEVLYREGSFGLNFVRGLGIVFCWLALLATIGLASASLLSFPVAAFFSLAVLCLGLSTGILSTVAEQNTIFGFNTATSKFNHSTIDYIVVPIFKGSLWLVTLVQGFSPIDALSSGRSITWSQLGLAVTQIIVLLGGIFCVTGIILFTRRELATAQSNS